MIMMLWVVTEKMRLWIQADKMVFLCRVPELSCRDKGEELRVELLLFCIKRRQLRLFGQLIGILLSAFLWRFSRHDKLGGDPEADPEPASHLAWECLGENDCRWRRNSVLSCSDCCHRDASPDEQEKMKMWMQVMKT